MHEDPQVHGETATRWTLAGLRRVCPWLTELTLPGVWGILERLDIRLKRARDHIHSPDGDYRAKIRCIQVCFQRSLLPQGDAVLLFLDEMSYYRQPTLSRAYTRCGPEQPWAERSYRKNTEHRVLAALNGRTGQVTFWHGAHVRLETLVTFYQTLCVTYAGAQTLYVALDNWPVHFHPDVLAALEPQWFPWPYHVPDNWRLKPRRKALRLNLPIQLLPLPTYAPWTNPIEKLWRWLRQEVLHLHRDADRWPHLHERVSSFLAQFKDGSPALLRYVGLTARSQLYGEFFPPAPAPD